MYHDGEFVDFFPVRVQTLVSFSVVLIDAGFGGEESLLSGLDIGKAGAMLCLKTEWQ